MSPSEAQGCPRCGTDRLRSAPVPMLGLSTRPDGRRRYRCTSCGWVGWKHRLQRRRLDGRAVTQKRVPLNRAMLWTLIIVVFALWSGGALAKSCVASRPDADYVL